jgi:hypothetical protein
MGIEDLKIVSGGQTGADRAALDFAIGHGLPHGGWCPKGRMDKEISKALKKEEQLWKERGKQVLAIIPLNLDGYVFDPQWQDWKKQHLTDRVAADFTGWESDNAKFEAHLASVVKALRADAGAREQPPKPKL